MNYILTLKNVGRRKDLVLYMVKYLGVITDGIIYKFPLNLRIRGKNNNIIIFFMELASDAYSL